TVSGSPLSEELQELQQWIMNHFMSYNDKATALAESGDEAGSEALFEEMHKAIADHCKEVYLNHLQDPIGVQAMHILVDATDEEFISLYEQGGECIHADAMVAGRYESLTATKRTVIQLNPSGDDFIESNGNLSDFIGQGAYVLVDFWASWCGPCRDETPFVIKAYNDYKDKGLIVLGIPVEDKQDATKEAMKQLGIHYPQLLDPGAATLAEEYGVNGIPHLFLFGPDGKVLQDGMRGEGIDAALKPLFQK
ncbi:MAG: TlpA family protein disulfide reductase, partial [Bacteroidales bacterium]|nr:TlpA family protein disulfide reductase [Bacteroidales bacterium]